LILFSQKGAFDRYIDSACMRVEPAPGPHHNEAGGTARTKGERRDRSIKASDRFEISPAMHAFDLSGKLASFATETDLLQLIDLLARRSAGSAANASESRRPLYAPTVAGWQHAPLLLAHHTRYLVAGFLSLLTKNMGGSQPARHGLLATTGSAGSISRRSTSRSSKR